MMGPFRSKEDESFNRSGSGVSSVSGFSIMSHSKKIDEAKHLSKATSQATLAATSILSAGGTEDAALEVAKAAAQATLLQAYFGVAAFGGNKGGAAKYLSRRKIRKQSDIVASMALVTASNQLKQESLVPKDDSATQKMSIVSPLTASSNRLPPLVQSQRPPQPPPPTTEAAPVAVQPLTVDTGSVSDDQVVDEESMKSENSKVSHLSMSSAPFETKQQAAANENFDEKREDKVSKTQNQSIKDTVEKKRSSESKASSKKKKPLEKGALSLVDSENVEVMKEHSDSETKENHSPKETPTLLVAPSPKAEPLSPKSNRESKPFKLLVAPTRETEPQGAVSPMDSVKANLQRKKRLPKSIFSPANTYFTEDIEPRSKLAGKPTASHPDNVSPLASPIKVSMMRSPRFDAENSGDDDTFTSEPIYIVERERHCHQQHRRRRDREELSSSSSEESSSFFWSSSTESETYAQTKSTGSTGERSTVNPIASLFASLLKCGAGLHNMQKSDLPDEESVRQALKDSAIIVNTASLHPTDDQESVNVTNKWEPRSTGSRHGPQSPSSRFSPKWIARKASSKTPKSGGRSTRSQSISRSKSPGRHVRIEEASRATEPTKSTDESGMSKSASRSTSSGEVPPDGTSRRSRGSRRPRGGSVMGGSTMSQSIKQVNWKKALGLKPGKQKRRSAPANGSGDLEPVLSDSFNEL